MEITLRTEHGEMVSVFKGKEATNFYNTIIEGSSSLRRRGISEDEQVYIVDEDQKYVLYRSHRPADCIDFILWAGFRLYVKA